MYKSYSPETGQYNAAKEVDYFSRSHTAEAYAKSELGKIYG